MTAWLERFMGLPLIWAFVAVVLLVMRRRVQRWAQRRAAAGAAVLDEDAVSMFSWLYLPPALLAAGYFVAQIVPLAERWRRWAENALAVLATIFAVWVAWRGFSLLLHYWAETNPNAKTLVPPVQLLARVFFAALGLALVFSGLGYSLTKVWTALGIGSVAVALALQDTLSNSFAGFTIMLDQPFRVGDTIKVDSGEEGRVIRIGWRSTWLQTMPNNIIVIPNSKLTRSSITNYTLPQPRLAVATNVPVSYGSDARRVRALLEDVARKTAAEVEGLLADPPPIVRFSGFGDTTLNFTLICQVREFADQQLVQDELRFRIYDALQRAGIEMEAPQRALIGRAQSEQLP